MKKITLAGFAILMRLALTLCACGGSASLEINANWYKLPAAGNNISGKSETLVYDVTFTKAEDVKSDFTYDKGTYTTSLTAESVTLSSGAVELGYHLNTVLSIGGSYTKDGNKEEFHDRVESDVWFRNVSTHLQPVRSYKAVQCTAPVSATAVTYFDYTYEVKYNTEQNDAEITYKQKLPESENSEQKRTVSTGDSATYFDNEQLLFLLRGLNVSSSVSFRSINPLDSTVTGISASPDTSVTLLTNISFELSERATEQSEATTTTVEGKEANPLSVYSVSLAYTSSFPGQPQSLIYCADTTEKKGENIYRNMLVSMSVPVLQNLGTLNYKLVSASFVG